MSSPERLGLSANAGQLALLVGLNALIGGMVGLERSVLPLVGERDMPELDAGSGGQVGGRTGALDQRRQAGDVVGLDVRLEHGHDRRPDRGGCHEVLVDEIGVRVDDGEPGVGAAAEQVAGT